MCANRELLYELGVKFKLSVLLIDIRRTAKSVTFTNFMPAARISSNVRLAGVPVIRGQRSLPFASGDTPTEKECRTLSLF